MENVNEYHTEIYKSEDFYEIQSIIENVRTSSVDHINEIGNIGALQDLKTQLLIVMDEIRRLEREY